MEPGILALSGAQPEKKPKYTPLYLNRWFTGLVSQRNIFVQPGGRADYRFYGGRPDVLLDGLNIEITNAGTLKRRPGITSYTTTSFPTAILSGYSFLQLATNNTTNLFLMFATATDVYTVLPTSKTSIFTYSASAGQTFFHGVGSFLYFGNGNQLQKWDGTTVTNWGIAFPSESETLAIGPSSGTTSGSPTWTNPGNITAPDGANATNTTGPVTNTSSTLLPFSTSTGNLLGKTFGFSIPTGANVLGFLVEVLTNETQDGGTHPGGITDGTNFFSVQLLKAGTPVGNIINTPIISTTAAYYPVGGSSELFGTSWSASDVNNANFGVQLIGNSKWRLPGFSTSSTVSWFVDFVRITVFYTAVGGGAPTWTTGGGVIIPTWQASTWYLPENVLVDTNGNLQQIQNSGVSGGTTPTWATTPIGAITTDGQIKWKLLQVAPLNWQNGHAYTAGQYAFPTAGTSLMKVTVGGVSGGTEPTWNYTNFGTTTDNTVTWEFIGRDASSVVWTASSNYGATTQILDTNQNIEQVFYGGLSGTTQPTWPIGKGSTVFDAPSSGPGILWINQGVQPFVPLNGGYMWVYTFETDNNNIILASSSASAPSTSTGNIAATAFTVSGIGSADPQVNTIGIWRTEDGGNTFFRDASIPNPGATTWTYVDSNPDSALNILLQAPINHVNDPPPAGLIAYEFHAGRLWGAVGNTVYYATGPDTLVGNPQMNWAPLNFFVFPSPVYGLLSSSAGLLVFTATDLYIIRGTVSITGLASGVSGVGFYTQVYVPNLALTSFNAFAQEGNQIFAFTANREFVQVDATGVNQAGFAIGDKLNLLDPTKVYLTSHVGSSLDAAVYLSDGSSTIYRLNPNQAPEGGPCWSTPAVITGGVGFIASLYTSLGVRQLLVSQGSGPFSLGFRDLNNFSDLGTPYPAYATLGSLVLAQPGQLAEVKFITLESLTVGSAPVPAILWDEITGSFDELSKFTDDPPQLSPSQSLYAQRFYMSQIQNAIVGRTMILKISFEPEAYPSELYALTIGSSLIGE